MATRRGMPVEHLGAAEVGAWFGVSGATVSKWRDRYPDTPTPNVTVGRVAGWLPGREEEWRAWEANRPGRGAGGGRPKRQPE